jgi:hypothetical protein
MFPQGIKSLSTEDCILALFDFVRVARRRQIAYWVGLCQKKAGVQISDPEAWEESVKRKTNQAIRYFVEKRRILERQFEASVVARCLTQPPILDTRYPVQDLDATARKIGDVWRRHTGRKGENHYTTPRHVKDVSRTDGRSEPCTSQFVLTALLNALAERALKYPGRFSDFRLGTMPGPIGTPHVWATYQRDGKEIQLAVECTGHWDDDATDSTRRYLKSFFAQEKGDVRRQLWLPEHDKEPSNVSD